MVNERTKKCLLFERGFYTVYNLFVVVTQVTYHHTNVEVTKAYSITYHAAVPYAALHVGVGGVVGCLYVSVCAWEHAAMRYSKIKG